jgi:homoserine O-acetyltransferase
VIAQYELVTKGLGIKHASAVLGWSMGGVQTYQWVTQYPDFMDLIVPICGSAKTSLHNQVFLEGMKSVLLAARNDSWIGVAGEERTKENFVQVTDGKWTKDQQEMGLKALGRVYADWGSSQAFYCEKLYESNAGVQVFGKLHGEIFGRFGRWPSTLKIFLLCSTRGRLEIVRGRSHILGISRRR